MMPVGHEVLNDWGGIIRDPREARVLRCRCGKKLLRGTKETAEQWRPKATQFMQEHGCCPKHWNRLNEEGKCPPCEHDAKRAAELARKLARALDGKLCGTDMHDNVSRSFYRCDRPSKVKFEPESVPAKLKPFLSAHRHRAGYYCGTHDPTVALQRECDRREKWKERDRKDREREKIAKEERGMVKAHDIIYNALAALTLTGDVMDARRIAREAVDAAEKIMRKARRLSLYEPWDEKERNEGERQ